MPGPAAAALDAGDRSRVYNKCSRTGAVSRARVSGDCVSGQKQCGQIQPAERLLGRSELARTSSNAGLHAGDQFLPGGRRVLSSSICRDTDMRKVPEARRRSWKQLIEAYLLDRKHLALSILLLDARRGWMEPDLELREWLEFHNRPYLVVATKTDKLKNQSERHRGLAAIRHDAGRRSSAVLGRNRPGSEGNLASDLENAGQTVEADPEPEDKPAEQETPPDASQPQPAAPSGAAPATAASKTSATAGRSPSTRTARKNGCDHAGSGRAQGDEHSAAQPDRQGSGRAGRRRHAQAGPDLQDPAGAGRKERADLLRRRAGDPAGRLRLPARARLQLPARARTTSTSRPRRSAASTCAPATPSPARSARPRKASATSPCSRSRRSTSSRPRGPQQDLLRQPDAALSARAAQAGNRARTTSPAASWTC